MTVNEIIDSACRTPVLRRYFDALNETAIVATTDRAGTITLVNDTFCAISKYTREELIGENHRILNSGRHPRSFFAEMFRAIASGRTWRGDVCNRAKDGSLYWVDTTIVPMRDDAGAIDGYFSIRQDITERKGREAASEQAAASERAASEAKSAFLANMSHEIRTPLNAILGFTEVLGNETIAEPERREHLETIRRNGEHLLSVINDVLDISKIEAGRMTVERVELLTVELFAQVISLMQVRADAKGLALDLEFETEIPRTIRTDPVRLRQILLNLIGNAVKFTEIGGVRVLVGLEEDPDEPCLRIEVADTGIGMTRDQADRVFQPFAQADSSTTRKFGGTGLGLHISNRLAGMLDGEILLTSEKGVGTSFIVRVPTGTGHEADRMSAADAWDEMIEHRRSEERAQRASLSGVLAGRRVLVAEDGPDNQRLVRHYLEKAGASVEIAENGRIALERITADPGFDAVLMDVQMPEMDGHEATRRLRRGGFRGPIIALTAHAMSEERDAILASGCDGFLTKPVARTTLVETIDHWIDGGRARAA
jgi:PAS domain S-box-containing protein